MFNASFIPNDGEWVVRFVVLCWLIWKRICRLAKQGRELGMDSTLFTMAPVDIACFIEKEQRDSSPVTALPLTIEQEMTFDPGGSMRVF
ncbi:hypothetical protein V6N13_107001 [Hibiscus sabdariffa]